MSETISKLIKRSGEISDFDQDKIKEAIYKASLATGVDDHHLAKKLTDQVVVQLNQKFHKNSIPAVEEVQDMVEEVLIENKLIMKIIENLFANFPVHLTRPGNVQGLYRSVFRHIQWSLY